MGDEGEKQVEIWKVKRVSEAASLVLSASCLPITFGQLLDAYFWACSSSKLWRQQEAMERP